MIEVGWDLELVVEGVSTDWESDSHVVADVL